MAKTDHSQRVAHAREEVLAQLAAGSDLNEIHRALAQHAQRDDLLLAEMLIALASEVIALGGFSASDPVEYQGFRQRFLPEIEFRGKVDHRNSQYAIYAAALMHGGMTPDVVSDTGWWRSELWPYALYGLVAYLRAAADRRQVEVDVIVRELAERLAASADR